MKGNDCDPYRIKQFESIFFIYYKETLTQIKFFYVVMDEKTDSCGR